MEQVIYTWLWLKIVTQSRDSTLLSGLRESGKTHRFPPTLNTIVIISLLASNDYSSDSNVVYNQNI